MLGRPVSLFSVVVSAAILAAAPHPPIVLTQLSPKPESQTSRIVRLLPGGAVEVLSRGFASASDPHVSFDGNRILFSAKRAASDYWQVFEMDAAGGGVRQIVQAAMDCRSPIYQSSLYILASDQPWHQVSFVGSARGASPSLYSVRLDGSDLRRITYNPYADLDPVLMEDGRILYAARQQDGLALFGVNLDGTDAARYAGSQGAPFKGMPTVTAGRLVVFVESETPAWDGAGRLAAVSLRRPFHSYRALTQPAEGLYHSPSPLPDGQILVSRRPVAGAGTHGIFRFHPETRQALSIFDDPDWHDIQAQVIAPRAEPDGRSSVVDPKEPAGVLYCLNSYVSDLPRRDWLSPATANRLRVIEAVPEIPASSSKLLATRILGEVPVDEDGSFHIRVPANIPIQLQLLDDNGMALRSCKWIWVRNKENRGCIGCHEDPELTPENRLATALTRPSMNLTLPPERRRMSSFRQDVAPVLNAKCASAACHGGAVPPSLVSKSEFETYIFGAARTSPLVWRLYSRKTARPWDNVPVNGIFAPMPPPGATPLTDQEKRTIIEWIDLGAQP
jgi:hypothetical protein